MYAGPGTLLGRDHRQAGTGSGSGIERGWFCAASAASPSGRHAQAPRNLRRLQAADQAQDRQDRASHWSGFLHEYELVLEGRRGMEGW